MGGCGIVFAVLAWWRLRKANRVLRAAMRLHDVYMTKMKGTGENGESTA